MMGAQIRQPDKGYLKVQAAFSAFQSSLHIPNRYSIPHLAPAAAQPAGNFFSQRPSGNPYEISTHPRPAAGRSPVRPSRA
ncbi:hypothetical protein, partial [Kingella denitrificans]|uniref:hypothetical protein n=1 Tax=Kingella denitrificans TaxID=502 RepID=UPI00288B53D6